MAILREKTNTKSIPIYHRVARILREGLPIWKPLYLHKVVKGKEEKRGRKRERTHTLDKNNRFQFKPRTDLSSPAPVSF